ncbi:hypothetical protein IWW54_004581 [Coemansia sp. RSA 2705]|nr:hypothetical protein IWW54_004581 [Coemansia sp. RSA 2705]
MDAVDRLWAANARTAAPEHLAELLAQCTLAGADGVAAAAGFADPAFEWATPRVAALADAWIARAAGPGRGALDAGRFLHICRRRVLPYFADGARRTERWRAHPQSVGAFGWALARLDGAAAAGAVGAALPVLVSLLASDDAWAQRHGLRLAAVLAARAPAFVRASGVGGVLEERVHACLVFRSDAERGAELLAAAFDAGFALADTRAHTAAPLWRLADRLVANAAYAGDRVRVLRVLAAQVPRLAARLGVAVARHLRALVGVLAAPLRVPARAPEMVGLHGELAAHLCALARACPARMRLYVDEAVAALACAWAGAADAALQQRLRDAMACMRALDAPRVRRAAERLDRARPGQLAGLIA